MKTHVKKERKPNPNQTNNTKPAQTTRLSRKLKTTVVQGSELKQFLDRKKKERELKQNLKINVPV